MALYEYFCEPCQLKFEEISSVSENFGNGVCPHCKRQETKRLISKFAIGGQGDLRESTLHGCHECEVSLPGDKPAPQTDAHDDHGGTNHGSDHDH